MILSSLAQKPVPGPQKTKSLIETRGEGGYCIVAPSGGQVHPSGNPYRLISGGPAIIVTITPQERQTLFSLSRTFDQAVVPQAQAIPLTRSQNREQENASSRPGDLFNARVQWKDILPEYGWEFVRSVGEEAQWRRPGKRDGISATTNYKGSDRLFVFSTSTPLEAGRSYSKFSAYTYLEHNGDFSASAKALAELGYIDDEEKKSLLSTDEIDTPVHHYYRTS